MTIMKNNLKYIGIILLNRLVYFKLIFVMLFIWFSWQFVDRILYREDSINSLEIALRSAKNNRKELEKVLCYYQKNPADSLKYKAVCFLIENMPFCTYSVGEQLENYKFYYAWLKQRNGKTSQQIADSVKKVFGPMQEPEKKRDILEIDSAYLCHNINWAFKVWQEQPWGKNISFETFCEYLLPHRIGDEPLAYWREMYYEKYNSLLDSLRMSETLDKEDPIVAAQYLMERLPDKKTFYTSITPYSFGHIGPEFVQYKTGSCREVADFGIYLFRALGIPCAIDYLPARSNLNAGHLWLISWDKNGEGYMSDFMGKLVRVRKSVMYNQGDGAKIYRYTFSANRDLYGQMAQYGEELYPFWHVPKFKDATFDYSNSYEKELVIPLEKQYKDKRKGKIAYLCASFRNRWVPIDWTGYNTGHLAFRYVRNGSVMRVATYENGALHFLTDPFYTNRQTGETSFYSAEKEKQDMILYAKCQIEEENNLRERMMGGVFEGSNQPDFSEKDTLFIIQSKPGRLNTTAKSWSDKEYRYLRYIGPPKGHCNVSEIAFYEKGASIAVTGKVIGTPETGQQGGTNDYTNVFDGKTWTSFHYSQPTGGWVGLDLGRKAKIDRIVYTPRNRDNYIRPGDDFELYYCDKDCNDWKSLGGARAIADSLIYKDVPKNALLLLRNHTRGVGERIFVYENGVQVWK